jgi:hypothetical protein
MRGIVVAGLLALAGCAPTTLAQVGAATDLLPSQAIERAATVAPAGIGGVFRMTVRATGRQDGNIYLNSERDYRDQRDLTIVVPAIAQARLAASFGGDVDEVLRGKTIRVRGVAHRVTIWFTADGKRTDKYYYQTHVGVLHADQIKIVG